MTTYTWATGSGGFDQASSWNPQTAPTPGDTAILNANGGSVSGNGDVGMLIVSAASWSLTGQVIAGAATIDSAGFGVLGTSAQLEVNGSFAVGLAGSAALYASVGGEIVDTAAGSTVQFGNASFNLSGRAIASFSGSLNLGVNGTSTSSTLDAALLTVGGTLEIGAGGSPASGAGTVTLQDGAELVMSGIPNSNTRASILQLGAAAATAGTLVISGTNSLLLSTNNSSTVGVSGTGTLQVTAGGSARFGTANNGLLPALTLAANAGSVGSAYVSGTGTLLNATGSIVVGGSGSATLAVSAGASVVSSASTQSAFSVAAYGGVGSVSISGTGSSVVAGSSAVVGGDNRGAGVAAGGTGTVSVTNGGSFQVAGALTVFGGSQVQVDGSSNASVGGNLGLTGSLTSYGTLSVGGSLYGTGALQIGAGTATLAGLSGGRVGFVGGNAALTLQSVNGASTINGMQYGDTVDLAGITAVNIGTNELFFAGGATIQLTGAPADTSYVLASDGNGGTELSLSPGTVPVYRFFDTNYGTHFFTASTAEEQQILATRPDLHFEGVGMQSIDPAAGDPNASPVYRFFDTNYGTHFFTASSAERDAVLASRPDLHYEGVGYLENTTPQPGDVPVYRFFDKNYGTHFYTASSSEAATIMATRPDLASEGIGFYAPG